MFGFGKSKKDKIIESAAALVAITLTLAHRHHTAPEKKQYSLSSADKLTICDELTRLQTDHWDKDAFNALKEFIQTL